MRGFRDILRPLKHHVLEQVGKSRPAFTLVTRAYVVINRDRNDRNGMIFIQNNAQAVIQTEFFYGCMWNLKSFLHDSPI